MDLVYQTFANPAQDNVEPQLTETMLLERAMSERPLSRQGRGRINVNGGYPIWRTRADYLLPPNKPTSRSVLVCAMPLGQ